MAWGGALLTDSGGFQVYSLGGGFGRGRELLSQAGASTTASRKLGLVKITEDGVLFCSHLDGSAHFSPPEKAIEVQEALGADVIMAFDECPPAKADRTYHEAALARTQRWLIRCREAWLEAERIKAQRAGPACGGASACAPSLLFGIAQGGLFPDSCAGAR